MYDSSKDILNARNEYADESLVMFVTGRYEEDSFIQGTSTSRALATLVAEARHPSSRTIPSQHQPPTSQTFPSPFRQSWLFSSPGVFWRKIWLTICLLVDDLKTRVNVAVYKTFSGSIGAMGQVVIRADDGCSWIVSVAVAPEHMWRG